MGSLISIGLKMLKPFIILFLLAISHFSLICCLSFFKKANNFNFGVIFLGIAIILKLLLNIASFANFKVVQKYGWLTALIFVSALDIVVFAIPFLIFFFKEILGFNRPKNSSSIQELFTKTTNFIHCEFNALNEFQYHFSGFLLLYISLALALIIYFRKNYRKAS